MMKPIVLAFVALAACGPLYDGSAAKGFLGFVQAKATGIGAAPAEPVIPVSRAQVDANPGAFLLVTAYGGKSIASMVQVSVNENRVTWISADNVTVTLENGIIVATRGLPRDLIGAQASGVAAALSGGGGQASRIHETIDDLDQISTEVLQCSIVFDGAETIAILGKNSDTRRFKENCKGENLAFTNTYWLGAGGAIIRSNQAVSPTSGFLLLDVL